jgi:hypothetical protein
MERPSSIGGYCGNYGFRERVDAGKRRVVFSGCKNTKRSKLAPFRGNLLRTSCVFAGFKGWRMIDHQSGRTTGSTRSGSRSRRSWSIQVRPYGIRRASDRCAHPCHMNASSKAQGAMVANNVHHPPRRGGFTIGPRADIRSAALIGPLTGSGRSCTGHGAQRLDCHSARSALRDWIQRGEISRRNGLKRSLRRRDIASLPPVAALPME